MVDKRGFLAGAGIDNGLKNPEQLTKGYCFNSIG